VRYAKTFGLTPTRALTDPRLAENMTIWRAARKMRKTRFQIELSKIMAGDTLGVGSILLTLAAMYEDQ